jgi:hypothetical protein
MNVNSAVVLPRELLYAVAVANPVNKDQLAKILEDVPWRLDKFGDEILSRLNQINQAMNKE